MPLDATIPLRAASAVVDPSEGILALANIREQRKRDALLAQHQKQQSELTKLQTAKTKLDLMEARDQQRLKSTVLGGLQMEGLVEAQDWNGLASYATQRKAAIESARQMGIEIDSKETDEILRMIQKRDLAGMRSMVANSKRLAPVLGIGGSQQQAFTLAPGQQRFDSAGNVLASVPAAQDNQLVEIADPNSPTGSRYVPRAQAVNQPGKPPTALATIDSQTGTIELGGQQTGGRRIADQRSRIKEAETVGTYYGGLYTDLLKQSDSAVVEGEKLTRLDQLLDQVTTGRFRGRTTEVKRAAKGLGVDLDYWGITDDTAPAEAAKALSNAMALDLRNPDMGAGMPGAMSDKDREFLVSMVPGIETSQEGRKLMVESRRRILTRKREIAKMARDYRRQHGTLDEGFSEQVSQHAEQHPLFADIDMTSAEQDRIPTPQTATDYARLPSGARYKAPDGSIRVKP